MDGKNWVGADFTRLKEARDKVSEIYKEYRVKISTLEQAKQALKNQAYEEGTLQYVFDEMKQIDREISSLRLSKYSLTNVNEFFAESFVYTEYGGNSNEYAMRTREIIDAYFRR
jgi:hypothetical protein